ncbi:hypothetical protein [Nocardia transvalensis]|uniref:hypothetical protein n=1 Tax=Nocardia transvalensis TaxID=37333 RepID=UPI0018946C44|nr:hypothetical protein [Nocardia transvalensis]MBF6331855.1 hypothetical protein [Nocardia transvalensis]
MALPDKGQRAGQAMYEAAKAGEFRMPEEGALRLAAACDKLADGLYDEIAASSRLTRVTGFPDLPSGRALTQGFSNKGQEYMDTLAAFREAVLHYKAAYLAAGKKFNEADDANRAAIKATEVYLEDNT